MTDLKNLRELAAKATKNVDHIAIEDTFPTMWFVDKKGENQDITNDDLIFWEKANPETVIALLDELDTVQIVIADVESKILSYLKDCVGDGNCECGADDVQGFSVTCYLHAALVRLNQLKKVNHE